MRSTLPELGQPQTQKVSACHANRYFLQWHVQRKSEAITSNTMLAVFKYLTFTSAEKNHANNKTKPIDGAYMNVPP